MSSGMTATASSASTHLMTNGIGWCGSMARGNGTTPMIADSIRIYRTRNGYIVRTPDDRYVIEEKEGAEAEAARDMLWQVNEAIGHVGSRHDEWRVRIVLEHGDKWISPEEHKALLGGEA